MPRRVIVVSSLAAAIVLGGIGFPAASVAQTIYTYSGDTKIDCPRCLNKPWEQGMVTRPNTAARRAACVENKRCTPEQVAPKKK